MKRLAKWLAIFALVVVVGAAWKSIITTKAEDPAVCAPNGLVKILGPACGPEANIHPDINIKLRGFRKIENGDRRVKIIQSDAPDPKHPRLDTLFDNWREHPITGLFHVGTWEGTDFYTDWAHLVGFAATPTEAIHVPESGYTIGCGTLEVLVLYADNNSITLKYSLDDNMVSGYGIHILGIKPSEEILAAYRFASTAGRKEMPALSAGTTIGYPIAGMGGIWVSIRDTGAFLDPRSYKDFWSANDEILNFKDWANSPEIDLPEELNLGKSPRGQRTPACDVSGFQSNPYYPPLGSLQECPVEYPTVGTVLYEATGPDQPNNANTPTDLKACDPLRKEEPAECKTGFKNLNEACSAGDPTGGKPNMGWCNPSSCANLINNLKNVCNGNVQATKNHCGKYTIGFCENSGVGDGYWLNRIKINNNSCSNLAPQDAYAVGRCLQYNYPNTVPTNNPLPPLATSGRILLPACVPTADKTQYGRCTSACGDKLTITESLGFNIQNNCATGTCKATIKIDPTTQLYAPLAKNLADYFAGTMDAGAVAEGTLTKARLKELQMALANPPVTEDDYATLSAAFNHAGVARKLLPLEIQDQLKCQFVKYVKNKIESKQNTKYRYLVDGKETFFLIDGVSVKDYDLPPKFDPDFKNYDPRDMNVGCSVLPIDPPSYISSLEKWSKSPSGLAWVDVPLFDNDEAQGKIEFVSGGVFTNELNPIQTSIPEIRRLSSATNIIQQALMPQETSLPPDERPAAITPQSRFLTIGPEIRPKLVLNACTKTQTLKELYDAYDLLQAKNATDNDPKTVSQIYYPEPQSPPLVTSYSLGVECLQNGGNLPKDSASLSKVCSVGPEGQINCFQQLPAKEVVGTSGRKDFPEIAVQTRNVTPYLYDTYLQTIDQSRGVLRIFQPYVMQMAGDNKLDQFRANDEFEKNFMPLPAESNEIKYLLDSNTGVTLKPEDGWKLLFDKLGGIYTAKEFVLKLLKPAD